MASRSFACVVSLPALLGALSLAACDSDTSGAGGSTATTTTTDTSSGGGGATSTGGTSTGGATGGSGGATGGSTSSGGSGGATTSSTTDTGGSVPACGSFARRYGSDDAMGSTGLAGAVASSDGGVIVAGDFAGKIVVGGATLTAVAGQDAFVAALKPNAGVAWAKRFGAAYDDKPKAIVATDDGGAVLVGTFDGVVDFFGTTLTSIAGPDAFVLRLDAAGDAVFVLQIENADARSVAIADGGDIVVAGDFTGSTSIAGQPLTADGAVDLFVARLGGDGSFVAARHAAFPVKPGAIAVASGGGHTYLTGSFQGTVDLGAGPLVSAGAKDILVASFDDALQTAWAKRFGDDSSQEARAAAVLSDGSVAITGNFKSVIDFDGAILTADTQDDVFLARFDPAGAIVVAERFGDPAAQIGRAIAVDANDDLLVAGGFSGAIAFGGATLTSAGGEDAFLARFDANGVPLKAERWGEAGDQRARSAAVDACGAVVLGGEMSGSIAFDADQLDATGAQDAFVARRAP